MKYNESGCIDKTAYAAINRIRKDERKKIIYEMKELAQKHGYKIISIILDLCQYFGQKKLKYYADFFSSSSSLCCGVI